MKNIYLLGLKGIVFKQKTFVIILVLCFCYIYVDARNFYFSSSTGNDSYSVTQAQNQATPWKSIQQLNSIMNLLLPGDFVYLKRGDSFDGTIVISASGTTSQPILFGAYGTGAKPIINGFTLPSSFTSVGGGVFETNALPTGTIVNQILINGIEYAMGRYPNADATNGGYLNFESFGTNQITDNELPATPNWTGADVVIRSSRWTLDELKITNHTGTTIQYSPAATYTLINKYGYFIQNSEKTLDQYGEWYYNPTTKTVKIFFGASIPTGTQVRVSVLDNLLNISASNVVIENLNFWGANGDAVKNTGNLQNITIRNCYILNSGVNAISITGETPNAIIDSCTISNTNNNAITLTAGCINATITKNVITSTGILAGMGKNADGNYMAIRCDAPGVYAENNRIIKCGYNGISFSKDNITIKNNLIDSFCMVKDDGAGIYTSTGSTIVYYNRKVTGNIVINGVGAKYGVDVINSYLPAVGIYLDENATNVDVSNNTVANCANMGMNVHNSRLFNVLNNTFYNNFTQFATSRGISPITGAVIKYNQFISKTSTQNTASFYSVQNDASSIGVVDSNYYARPILDSATIKMEFPNMGWGYRTLPFWQSYSGLDLKSKKSAKSIKNVSDFDFQYNASNKSRVYYFIGLSKIDVAGTVYNNSATIPAWGSKVLIANGTTPIVNQAPLADAGIDLTITLPTNTVILAGTGTDIDGTISSYRWTKIFGTAVGTISKTDTATTTLNNLAQGVYQYELTVTDNNGLTGKDTVQVTVNPALNIAPVVNAGVDISITLPVNTANLTGIGTDANGTITSYAWVKIAGPAAGNIVSATTASTGLTSLVQGVYQFQLTVTDNNGATGRDTVQVIVNPAPNIAPVANAGVDIAITLPVNTANLTGIGTDANGTISSYAWVKIAGPAAGNIVSASTASTGLTSLVQGVYLFQLTVTDNNGAAGRDTVQVIVNPAPNIAPVANAGVDIAITLPVNTANLTGIGTDANGTISSYTWVKIAGPAAGNIVSASTSSTGLTSLVQGVYQYQLTVTDNSGAIARDTVQVTVNPALNIAPIANAGVDIAITLPVNTATLTGIGTDANGTITSYAWVKIAGPAAGNIVSASTSSTGLTSLVQGVYQYQLTVTDNSGAIARDTVQVTVNPALNIAPIANAGVDIAITLPVSTATLTGIGTDVDGTISSYAWVKIAGPAAGNIVSASTASTGLTGLVQGVYQFQLTVTDNNGATGRDTVQLTVNPAPNIAPVANAGVDIAITLPVNTATLTGIGTDVDGTISSYAWVKIAGPATGNIVSASTASTGLTSLVQGVYQFQLTVTDNNGARGIDTVLVTVNPAANIAPVANAGVDISITLPVDTATLTGIGTDIDGTIISYAWVKIAGPTTGNIVSTATASTALTSLVQGVYQYQLTVTDNSGAIARDTVQVTVNAIVLLPAVNPLYAVNGLDYKYYEGYWSVLPLYETLTPIKTGTTPNFDITLANRSNNMGFSFTGYVDVPADGLYTFYTTSDDGSSLYIDNILTVNNDGYHAATEKSGIIGLKAGKHFIKGLYFQGSAGMTFFVSYQSNTIAKQTIPLSALYRVNIPPVSNAGSNISMTLPINSTTISGTGTDADGTISSYAWAKIAGPAAGNIISPNVAITSINGLVQGVYQFELTVTDNNGATGRDTVQVTVNPAPNIAPVANAGVDIAITLPVNTATLTGIGTDVDGTISSYAWVKIAGPATGNIVSASTASTGLTSLVQGVYQFQLTVTDNNGARGIDTVLVTVNPAANIAPVANAGVDISITLPVDTATLTGIGTDIDGTIISYAWVKIAGPTTGNIVSTATASTALTSLVQGVYQYQLTVTDNSGAIARDTVQVTVNAIVLLPAVNPLYAVNGLDYKYYEGYWSVLPLYETLTPIKTGTTPNFDITLANRSNNMGFSFTGYVDVPADGLYTFYTTSDDGSSLYIDNILTVNNDGYHAATEKSGIIGLKAGKHFIKGLYFQGPAGMTFFVSYQSNTIAKQTIPLSALYRDELLPAVNPLNAVNGLDYKYYEGYWSVLPLYETLTPIKTGTTTNFDITLANRGNNMGFSFTGYVDVPTDGLYTFYTTSDDGSSLYIDNILTVNNDGYHAATEKSGIIGLKAGKHYIKGLYFQGPAGMTFFVSYQSNTIAKQTIPLSALYRLNTTALARSISPVITSAPQNISKQLFISSYPNPSFTDFSLKIDGNSIDKVEIIVVNAEGNTVFKTSGYANKTYRFGNELQKGIYLIKVYQKTNIQTLKVVKL